MQLIYRGSSYSLQSSTFAPQQNTVHLSYRGVRYSPSVNGSVNQRSPQTFTYRGAACGHAA